MRGVGDRDEERGMPSYRCPFSWQLRTRNFVCGDAYVSQTLKLFGDRRARRANHDIHILQFQSLMAYDVGIRLRAVNLGGGGCSSGHRCRDALFGEH